MKINVSSYSFPFKFAWFICFIVVINLFGCKTKTNENREVNILFIMGDQHRGDCIGASGADWLETPNLDRLAQEGVLFENAYTSVPSCLPARTSILTGMSPWKSGQLGYRNIPDYQYEMPQMFTDAGYRTHAVGKNHFSPMRHKHGYQTVELEEAWYSDLKGEHATTSEKRKITFSEEEKCDYTRWFEAQMPGISLNQSGLGYTDHRGGVSFPFADELHPTYWTAERAVHFLQSYEGDEPWLLKVSFQRPHPPFDPPKRWLDHYEMKEIPMARIGDWAEREYGNASGSLEELPNATSGKFPEEEIEAARQAYYAAISFVDEQLGRVLEALEERGELENTLIIYTSDHGDMMGDQHMWRKCRPYEGSARIPMLLRWPKNLQLDAKRGQTSSELVELRDVLPTFLDAAEMQKPQIMDGVSMLNILKGENWRKDLDLEHSQIYEDDNAWVALTNKQYKYIYFTLTGQQQLFDLKTDPYELIDLASERFIKENEKLLEEWRGKMIKHLQIRGEEWVKDGELTIQKESIHIGKNNPVLHDK